MHSPAQSSISARTCHVVGIQPPIKTDLAGLRNGSNDTPAGQGLVRPPRQLGKGQIPRYVTTCCRFVAELTPDSRMASVRPLCPLTVTALTNCRGAKAPALGQQSTPLAEAVSPST